MRGGWRSALLLGVVAIALATAGAPLAATGQATLTPIGVAHSIGPQDTRSRAETTVTVDPHDPRRLAVSAIQFGRPFAEALVLSPFLGWDATWTSHDGGATFAANGPLPQVQPATPAGNDPYLSWGPKALYASYTGFVREGPRLAAEGLWVARSTDGGRSWRRTNHLEGYRCNGPDRSTISTDPRRDTVFVTWVHYTETSACNGSVDLAKTETRWAVSHDGGRTFSAPVAVTRAGVSNRIAGAALPDGTFATATTETYGIEVDAPTCQFPTIVIVRHWTAAGRLLGQAPAVQGCDDALGYSPNGTTYVPVVYPAITADPMTGGLVVATTSVDPTPGLRTGMSTDGGRTWRRASISGLPGSTASMPAVSSYGGRVAAAWLEVDVAGAYRPLLAGSNDGGRTWSEPLALSLMPSTLAARSTPVDGYNIGHYMGVAVGRDGVAHVVWPQLVGTPTQAADPDVFTASVRIS